MMEIAEGMEAVDLGLLIKEKNILIFSDFHMGYEAALNAQGIMMPRFHFKDVMERLKKIFEKLSPDIIIINGDLKHEFGVISRQEWSDVLKLIDYLKEKCKELIVIKGNHDKALIHVLKKRGIPLQDSFAFDNTIITHGDIIPENISDYKTIIIGHEHPAVSIRDGAREETFKCYLKGKYKRALLIVQPSFNLSVKGTDLLKESALSPFLKGSIDKFEVFIAENNVYYFGTIEKLRKL